MISRKIHYCWFGPAPLPTLVRKCMRTWQEVMPEYEICLWNEENSPMDHPFVCQAYAAKKYAFVADYVRFWALYHHGGVYLDTDMYVIRHFDDLLDNTFFSGYETPQNEVISCGIIGALQHCEVLRDILEYYDRTEFNPRDLAPFIVPRIMSPIVYKHMEVVKIYPYDYFYPLSYEDRFAWNWRKYATEDTYAIHLWNISWGDPWAKLQDRVNFIRKKIRHKI